MSSDITKFKNFYLGSARHSLCLFTADKFLFIQKFSYALVLILHIGMYTRQNLRNWVIFQPKYSISETESFFMVLLLKIVISHNGKPGWPCDWHAGY